MLKLELKAGFTGDRDGEGASEGKGLREPGGEAGRFWFR